MPLVNRYAGVLQGGMTLTGNTISIFPSTAYPPATNPYVTGAFISTDLNNQVVGYPPGTTQNGSLASSSAILNIPSGSEVTFAQLFWSVRGPVNAGAARTFTTPLRTVSVTPTLSDDTAAVSWRAANVTAIVNEDGPGTYIFGNIPVVTVPNGSNWIESGWNLVVVYKNNNMSYKYININTGVANVSNAAQLDYTFSGFSTPSTGQLKGYFFAVAVDGDIIDQAQIRVGAATANTQIGNSTAGTTWNSVAPYCRMNNMLPNNILNADPNDPNIGLLDTRGSFGTYNLNPYSSSIPAFARIEYDILGIDISNALTNGQTQLRTNITFAGSGNAVINAQAVQVQLNSANMGSTLLKTVDKDTASVGDTLTYTVSFANTGITDSVNVKYMDTTPNGTIFLSNSLYIDGVPSTRTNIGPSSPIDFGTVSPSEVHVISYSVAITTIPSTLKINNIGSLNFGFSLGAGIATVVDTINTSIISTTINYLSNPIINSSGFTYNYTVNPSIPNAQALYGDSSYAVTQINLATLVSNKMVNKTFANVNAILAYTIPILNSGNVIADNVIFQDTIAESTTFIPGSLTVNGVVTTGDINPPGINIGTIAAGQLFTIAYKVRVDTIPTINPTLNSATLQWDFTVDPSIPNGVTFYGNSKIVSTQINTVFLNCSKMAPSYGTVGSVLTYTIPIINTGNVSANNVVFKDTIPTSTTFVTNSLTQNGITLSGINPNLGFTVGTIAANSITTIAFSVLVTTIPSVNPVQNAANITYKYTVDPSIPNEISSSINTNIAYTQISKVFLNANKIVDKNFAAINDILTYTIPIINTGNVSANNVVFKDTIPYGASFISDSLTVNGITISGISPNLGFTVGTVSVGITTVSFKVNVDTIPSVNPIPNSANIIYNYTFDPSIPNSLSGVANTNIVTTKVSNPILNANKYVDRIFAKIGDVLTYTIPIINTGNTTANNVVFKDTIPDGTAFVVDSFTVNGVVYANTTPDLGFKIGTLPIGTTTIGFKVAVNMVPSINPILNSANLTYNFTINPSIPNEKSDSLNSSTASTQVNAPNIITTKTCDKFYVTLNDILTYTMVFKNIGSAIATNFIAIDTVPSGTVFVTNSITVNAVTVGGTPVSINVGTIPINSSATITFKVRII